LSIQTKMSPTEVRIWIANRKRFEILRNKAESKSRVFLSFNQYEALSDYLEKTSKPDRNEVEILATKTSLPRKKIYQWFAHQRFKKNHQ